MKWYWAIPMLVGILILGLFTSQASGSSFAVGGIKLITEIIDSTGDGAGNTLTSAFAIDTDSSGNVFVTGNAGDNVFKISTPGTCSTIGTPCIITEIIDSTGGGLGTLDEPFDLATDSSGNVFVSELQNGNVFKITPGGTITRIIASGAGVISGPLGVATDSSGNVFVGGWFSHNVVKVTPGGTITEIMDSTGDGVNSLNGPRRIATDSSGNVFIPSTGSDNVFKISTPGTCSTSGTPCIITEIIDGTGDGAGNTLTDSNKVATDSSGNVFVTGTVSDNAFKISTPGTCSTIGTPCTITEIIDGTGDGGGNTHSGTNGIATDSSGNVFVTGAASANAFIIDTPGTCSTSGTPCTITEIIDGTGDGAGNTLVNAGGTVTDSSGNVFVVGVSSNNVFKIPFDSGSASIGGISIPIDTTSRFDTSLTMGLWVKI